MSDVSQLQQASTSVRQVREELARSSRTGAALTNVSGLVSDLDQVATHIDTYVAAHTAAAADGVAAADDGQPANPTPDQSQAGTETT